jgi:hypothetical protein
MDKDSIIQNLINENLLILEENTMLKRTIQTLEEKIAQLEKNSSNSSKPPSSDIVKLPKISHRFGLLLLTGESRREHAAIAGCAGVRGYGRFPPPAKSRTEMPLSLYINLCLLTGLIPVILNYCERLRKFFIISLLYVLAYCK